MTQSAGRSRQRWILAAAVALVALVGFLLAEGMARLVGALERAEIPLLAAYVNGRMQLNPYQQPSEAYVRHWRLRPGWTAKVDDVAAMKRASGREEGARFLEEAASVGFGLPLSVNVDGFKGPDLLPAGTLPRLLAIGDSVTFGVAGWDYVRALEAAYSRKGLRVEGINAGVEGYSVLNALHELPRQQAVHAKVCFLMLGWNDIFAEDGSYGTVTSHVRALPVARRLIRVLVDSDRIAADKASRERPKVVDPHGSDIARYRKYRPAFLQDLETLASALEGRGCRVAISTLAGLYVEGEEPSAQALRIGHLPVFTTNPYVLAAMTASVNRELRDLAARRGWRLIDVAAWSDRVMRPRDVWFSDSVHLWAWGLARLGEFLAEELEGELFSERALNAGSASSR